MDRNEARKVLKKYFTNKGYLSQKSCLYKVFDEDYLVGISMESAGFMKAYQINCFAIYLPDESVFPLTGFGEISKTFWFPEDPSVALTFSGPDNSFLRDGLTLYFEYEKYSAVQFQEYLDANYDQFVVLLMDKNYGLNCFRNNWLRFARFSHNENRVKKICQRAGLNPQDIFDYLDWYYNKGGRLRRTAPEDQHFFRQYLARNG